MVHKSLYCHHFCFADRNPSSKRLSDLPKVPSSFVQGPDLRCVVRLQSCEFTHCPVPRLHSDCPGQCPQGAQGVDKHVDNYSTWQWNMRRTSGTHVHAGRAPALAPALSCCHVNPGAFPPRRTRPSQAAGAGVGAVAGSGPPALPPAPSKAGEAGATAH